MRVMKTQQLSRAVRVITSAVDDRLDLETLLTRCTNAIETVVEFDALFLSMSDPDTLQFSAMTHIRALPAEMCAPYMRNEFMDGDVNQFRDLSRAGVRVSTLREATLGDEDQSRRYREIYKPAGFGPELRALLSDGRHCWGYLTLLRELGAPDFSNDDSTLLAELTTYMGAALRDSHRWSPSPPTVLPRPGTLEVDLDGTVSSISDRAQEVLQQICAAPVHAVAASTLARAHGQEGIRSKARLRTTDGSWLTIRGDTIRDEDGQPARASIVVESAPPAHVSSIVARACGLSHREEAVLRHLISGRSTREIAQALVISEHTVRDHVKSIFRKTGASSRSELIHRFFAIDP